VGFAARQGSGDLNTWAQQLDDINVNTGHRAQQLFGLQIKMVERTLEPADTIAQVLSAPFAALSLRSSTIRLMCSGSALRLTLTTTGVKHAKQGFKTETKIGFTATKYTRVEPGLRSITL
jgi:hypothetical protein